MMTREPSVSKVRSQVLRNIWQCVRETRGRYVLAVAEVSGRFQGRVQNVSSKHDEGYVPRLMAAHWTRTRYSWDDMQAEDQVEQAHLARRPLETTSRLGYNAELKPMVEEL